MNLPSIASGLRLAAGCVALMSAAFIVACGGAIGSGGTGAAPPAVSGGTVTGFGSVVIDGLVFDDRQVPTTAETEPGADVPAESRMGHRVEVELAADGKPKALHIDASIVGAVSSISVTGPTTGSFAVLGQSVTANADARMGPVTQFAGGYASLQDIQAGHWLEIHGVFRPLGGGQVLQATRVERRATAPAYLRVSGIVDALGQGGVGRFHLGSLVVESAAATVLPAGSILANGTPVTVFAPPANLSTPTGSSPVLAASAVRVKSFGDTSAETYASGFVALLDAANGQFSLNGQTVKFKAADVQPAGTVLSNGQYVQVRGTVDATGALLATRVKRRDGESEPEAELKGNIAGFNAAGNTFTIRDVQVTVVASTELESCPATGLRDGLFVELQGRLGATGVIAEELHCKEEPSGAVIEREGNASAIDVAASSFTLTASGRAPIKVLWTTLTFFRNVTPQTLSGKKVEIEGTLVDGEIVASKVKVDD